MLKDVCQTIIEIGGYHLAWIGYAKQYKEKTFLSLAHKGSEDGYLDKANTIWSGTEHWYGPTSTTLRSVKAGITQNILDDAIYEPWRKQALHQEVVFSIAVPITQSVLKNYILKAVQITIIDTICIIVHGLTEVSRSGKRAPINNATILKT